MVILSRLAAGATPEHPRYLAEAYHGAHRCAFAFGDSEHAARLAVQEEVWRANEARAIELDVHWARYARDLDAIEGVPDWLRPKGTTP